MTTYPIKFRIWDKILREYLVYNKHTDLYETTCKTGSSSLQWCLNHPEDFLVEQMSAYLDEKGRELYDGDIVEETAEPHNRYVLFRTDTGWWFGRSQATANWGPAHRKDFVLVGNRNQNFDLLPANPHHRHQHLGQGPLIHVFSDLPLVPPTFTVTRKPSDTYKRPKRRRKVKDEWVRIKTMKEKADERAKKSKP